MEIWSYTSNFFVLYVQKDTDTNILMVCVNPFIAYCVTEFETHILAIFDFTANSAKSKYLPNIIGLQYNYNVKYGEDGDSIHSICSSLYTYPRQ